MYDQSFYTIRKKIWYPRTLTMQVFIICLDYGKLGQSVRNLALGPVNGRAIDKYSISNYTGLSHPYRIRFFQFSRYYVIAFFENVGIKYCQKMAICFLPAQSICALYNQSSCNVRKNSIVYKLSNAIARLFV